ncbi:MAG: dihydrolipoyl dehydrogenase [Clostridia bacterium]|nr:dihydrolipoyl dehydrogenase [Clostridia bacterium]
MEFAQIFDIIVIGGGPGGYHFANLSAKRGFSVALFEERSLGGTCLNEGCIPSKSFLKSAKIVDSINHSKEFGVIVDNFSVDQPSVVERKNVVVNKLVMGVRGGLRKNKVKLFFSHANILQKDGDTFAVESDGKIFGANKLIIATGSEVIIPSIKGVDEAIRSSFALTSREILDINIIPSHLVVVGAGVIGLEMASYFCSMGAKVTVVEGTSKICRFADNECSKILENNLTARGIEFIFNSMVEEITQNSVVISSNGEKCSLECDKVLLAIGRKARVEGFGLENLNLDYSNRGIFVDGNMQTTQPNVYAVGDVNGKSMLAHTAYKEAEVCIDVICGQSENINYDNIPSIVYTSPEFSSVGISEEIALDRGINFTVKKLPMIYSGKFVTENLNVNGICKIIIDNDSNKIIGAMMIGDGAGEVILALSNMISLEIPVSKICKFVFPHPSIGEIIKDTLNS